MVTANKKIVMFWYILFAFIMTAFQSSIAKDKDLEEAIILEVLSPLALYLPHPEKVFSVKEGEPIRFSARVKGSKNIALENQIVWNSSIDGYLSTENNFKRVLSVGTHDITAQLMSGDDTVIESFTIIVGKDCSLHNHNQPKLMGDRIVSVNTFSSYTAIVSAKLAFYGGTIKWSVMNKSTKEWLEEGIEEIDIHGFSYVDLNFDKSGSYILRIVSSSVEMADGRMYCGGWIDMPISVN